MDNINQFYQDSQENNSKPIIKSILLIVLGIALGIGMSVAFYFLGHSLLESKKDDSQESRAEITAKIKKDIKNNFSLVFEDDSVIDVYITEKEENVIDVSIIIALSEEEKFIEIFGINPEGEFATGTVIVAQAEYEMKGGEYILRGKPKVYWGVDLVLTQESLGTSQEKANDTSIKAGLSSMRAMAELWAMNHSESYKGFCYGTDAQKSITHIAERGKKVTCTDSYNTWAAFSSLYSLDEKCWCVDSSGTSAALYKSCPLKAVTVCP